MEVEIMNEKTERALDWEDEIEQDSAEFTVFPEGDYDFEVTGFERARYQGGEKIPPCNKAIIKIKIKDGEKSTTINHNLLLYSTLEWRISEFFISIGMKKKGEKVAPKWGNVIGSTGRAKIGIRKWENKEKRTSGEANEVLKLYPKEQKTFRAGEF